MDNARLDPSASKSQKSVLIFVVTFNAEKTIRSVLNRIPSQVFADHRYRTEILIIDDSSQDTTFASGWKFTQTFSACPLTILQNPINLGYGGNQKLGYRFAIDRNFDIVALLHGDGQYAPEELPGLLDPLLNESADAVFGSRMLVDGDALAGGMPLYKFIGNKILSALQNLLTKTALSEWHSGYRLYSTALLRRLPFERNSNGFDFDTEIIIQISAARGRICELPIPTFYGNEICHVNGITYSVRIIKACIQYRSQQLGLFYDPKFDLEVENNYYQPKFEFLSSHSLAFAATQDDDSCLLLGCGPLPLVKPFLDRAQSCSIVDMYVAEDLRTAVAAAWESDLDSFDINAKTVGHVFSKVIALDILEHLKQPEAFLDNIRAAFSCKSAELILTTPNIAFLPLRIMLLIGAFNYGKRGILDRSHTRLFTFSSLQRILSQSGYKVTQVKGIPPPIPAALGNTVASRILMTCATIACALFPRLFGFQIFVRAIPSPTVDQLLEEAMKYSKEEIKANLTKINM